MNVAHIFILEWTKNHENNFGLELTYDGHYCKYFESKPSHWTLELSTGFLKNLGDEPTILLTVIKSLVKLN